jgi:hypothetical protein
VQLSHPTRGTLSSLYMTGAELIVADLNLGEIDQEFLTLDVSGHYSRPDVFTFHTRRNKLSRKSSFPRKRTRRYWRS